MICFLSTSAPTIHTLICFSLTFAPPFHWNCPFQGQQISLPVLWLIKSQFASPLSFKGNNWTVLSYWNTLLLGFLLLLHLTYFLRFLYLFSTPWKVGLPQGSVLKLLCLHSIPGWSLLVPGIYTTLTFLSPTTTLNFILMYLTAYLTAPLGKLEGISNVICPQKNEKYFKNKSKIVHFLK